MSQGKVVNRNVVVVLAALLIIVVIAFSAALTLTMNDDSQAKKDAATIASIKKSNLINVGLGARDDGVNYPNQPNLHIVGFVVNTGSDTAYNVKLHVVAYYLTGAKAIDTYIEVGNGMIHGQDSEEVDSLIPYDVNALGQISAQTATMTPVWTNEP